MKSGGGGGQNINHTFKESSRSQLDVVKCMPYIWDNLSLIQYIQSFSDNN